MPHAVLRFVWITIATLLLLGAWPASLPAGEDPLQLLVFDRPPYYVLEKGQPASGFLLNMAREIFTQAGIPFVTREMPPGRILAMFEVRGIRACGVGWLRTPERETYARFSLPLYVDPPLGVVMPPEKARAVGPAPTLASLLMAGLAWGLRRDFSYGQSADDAFRDHPGQNIRLFGDTRTMLRLIAMHRLDAVLLSPEELSVHLAEEPELVEAIRFLPIADAPPGFSRHIMCDLSVPASLMDRIDAAIIAFRSTDRYREIVRSLSGR